MKIGIKVRKTHDEKFSKQLEFVEFPVIIGRESDNDIFLEDPKRIISRTHAKIENIGESFHLIDLGSANHTYLNGEKIIPNIQNILKNGDLIKIGDYELDILIGIHNSTNVISDDRTMVFSSPFDNAVKKVSEVMNELSEAYASDPSPLKNEMLRFSVMRNFENLISSDVSKTISEYFANKFLEINLTERSNEISLYKILSTADSKLKTEKKDKSEEITSVSSLNYSFSSHFGETVDVLIGTIIKLIQGFLHFKQEFFGVTIYQTIPSGSLKEIKDYLFDIEISSEEQKKRVNMIKDEMQKILLHQIGLLSGYKNSVTEGSQAMLQSLDPEFIEKEISSKSMSLREYVLPNIKKIKTLEAIKKSYTKYISDPYYIEKKFFRPSFIKGYQKPISLKAGLDE